MNYAETEKPDLITWEDDIVSLRGAGEKLLESRGTSRKGRIFLKAERPLQK